jgi:hypothetical protein
LDDYNARYYDPVVGRFVSADTKQGNVQGMDPYAYVQDNPETKNDPTGQIVCNAGGTCSQSPPQPPPCLTGLECAEIPFIGLRFGINYTKFWVDYLILQNKPASVADLLGLFDLKFPLYSNEDLLKALAPLLGISPHNAGRLFSSLEENAPGLLKLFEGLGHAANGIAALYDVLDIVNQLSSKNRNVTQLASDETNLASILFYYLSKKSETNSKLFLGASIVFAGISFLLNVAAFVQIANQTPPPNDRDRRDKRDDNNGGGGGPPFPPPFPVTAFLPPATNEQSTGSICLSVGGGFFSC